MSSLDLEIDDGGLGLSFVEGCLRPFGMAPSVVLAPLVCPEEAGGVSGVWPLGPEAPYGETIGYDQSLPVVGVGELTKDIGGGLFMVMVMGNSELAGSCVCCYTKCPGRRGGRDALSGTRM